MNRSLSACLGLLAIMLCAHCYGAAPLPPAPASGWCYVSVDASGYQDVNACATTPPPVNDPNAYTSLMVTWQLTPPLSAQTDVTQLFNLFGHISPRFPVQQWPGVSGSSIKYTDSGARHLRLRMHMPDNPGTLSHSLKIVSYGTTHGAVVSIAVVAPGYPMPTGPKTPCFEPAAVNDRVAVTLNPGADNTAKCTVAPGWDVDVLADVAPNAVVALVWN